MQKLAGMMMVSMCLVAGGLAGCDKTEECNVTISYVLEPIETLPEGLTSVAVLDAGVDMEGDEDAELSKKWAKIAADTIEALLNDAAKEHGAPISVQNRRQTTQVMQEKDMKMAGLVEGGAAAQSAQMLDVQAIISSQMNIRVDVKTGKSSTFDITSLYGGRGFGGASGGSREVDNVSRSMTLQCKFNMIDAATGEALFEYAPSPFRKTDNETPSPIYGRSKSEADLEGVDLYIGELVEKGVREFVSRFVPCSVEYGYELESGSGEGSVDGILALRAEDYERAMDYFKAATLSDPEDHRSFFAIGITSELMGDYDGALKAYKRAVSMRGLDEDEIVRYKAAMDRVQDHAGRIRAK